MNQISLLGLVDQAIVDLSKDFLKKNTESTLTEVEKCEAIVDVDLMLNPKSPKTALKAFNLVKVYNCCAMERVVSNLKFFSYIIIGGTS